VRLYSFIRGVRILIL